MDAPVHGAKIYLTVSLWRLLADVARDIRMGFVANYYYYCNVQTPYWILTLVIQSRRYPVVTDGSASRSRECTKYKWMYETLRKSFFSSFVTKNWYRDVKLGIFENCNAILRSYCFIIVDITFNREFNTGMNRKKNSEHFFPTSRRGFIYMPIYK